MAPSAELDPSTDQTGSKKGHNRVPKSKLAEIPFSKNIRILFTKRSNFLKIGSCQKYTRTVYKLHMIFKSLKDHTRGISTLMMSLAQMYQCYIQVRILTCNNDMSQVSTYPFIRYKPIIWPFIRLLEGNMSYVCSQDL